MYCDQCGAPFASGSQYCTSCGKQILCAPGATAAVGSSPGTIPTLRAGVERRVQRNLSLVAGLWAAYGVLRLLELGWLVAFRRILFGWGWPFGGWPGGWTNALNPWIWGGLFSGGVFMAVFGAAYLLLAWGLFERQPWARMLGIVLGLLVLIRIPFGTALGVYTLWVLLPESSGNEYDSLAGART
ncbi:MAG TPA: hypothetical protein VE077_03550 [Candidatus Methylomirabilis sp.]|nr:hypothetical protein [Candidatus Methylomirabilis sp.]